MSRSILRDVLTDGTPVCVHSPAVLSAAEANGSRRSAAAEAAAAGEDMDPAVGWGLSSADIEEAVGFHIFSSSSSPTCGSGRVHAVEEVKYQFNSSCTK